MALVHRNRALSDRCVATFRGEGHEWSHSGHSRLRRLLLPLEVPRMAMNLLEALPVWHRRRGHRVPPGVKYRPSDNCGGGAEWSIAVVHMAVAVGQILQPGEAGRFLRRWQRRHAAIQVGCSTNDRHGGSRRRGRAGGSMAKVVDPSILLADSEAKVERLIPASERGPG